MNIVKLRYCLGVFLVAACLSNAHGQSNAVDTALSSLTEKLATRIKSKGKRKITVLDFTDLSGNGSEFGRFIAEQITVNFVSVDRDFAVLDRANRKVILEQHNLTATGLIDPTNAAAFGKFAGVDALIVGTMSSLNENLEITAKIITMDTAEIIGAAKTSFVRSDEMQNLLARNVSTESSQPATGRGNEAPLRQTNALATKDIGSLRVALKSILQLEDSKNSIRVSFEFTNRDTKKSLLVALNAENQNRESRPTGVSFSAYPPTVILLRSRVLDDRGGIWNLSSSALSGLEFVRAGVHGRNGQDAYSPSDIVRLLQLRDQLGQDTDDPADGFYANADSIGEGGRTYTFDTSRGNISSKKFFHFDGNIFISGTPTTIDPGKNITVSMIFHQEGHRTTFDSPAMFFQMSCEIVVGIVESVTKKSFSLQNVTFYHVPLIAAPEQPEASRLLIK